MIPLAILVLQGTVNYRVTLEGGGQGQARLTQTRRPEGGKIVRLVLNLRRGNVNVELRTESTFDGLGNPIRKIQGYGAPGKAPEHETIVTFDAKGANAVVRERGVPKAVSVALAAKLNRANAAETWFSAVKPKKGDVAKAWTFDPNELEWVPTETTYVGPSAKGHLLRIVRRDKITEAIIDENGVPIEMESPGMKIERK